MPVKLSDRIPRAKAVWNPKCRVYQAQWFHGRRKRRHLRNSVALRSLQWWVLQTRWRQREREQWTILRASWEMNSTFKVFILQFSDYFYKHSLFTDHGILGRSPKNARWSSGWLPQTNNLLKPRTMLHLRVASRDSHGQTSHGRWIVVTASHENLQLYQKLSREKKYAQT